MNTPIKSHLYKRFDSRLKVAISRYNDSSRVSITVCNGSKLSPSRSVMVPKPSLSRSVMDHVSICRSLWKWMDLNFYP